LAHRDKWCIAINSNKCNIANQGSHNEQKNHISIKIYISSFCVGHLSSFHISIIFSEIIGASETKLDRNMNWMIINIILTFLSIGNSKWLLDQLCFLLGWNFLAKITFVMEFLHGGRYIPYKILHSLWVLFPWFFLFVDQIRNSGWTPHKNKVLT